IEDQLLASRFASSAGAGGRMDHRPGDGPMKVQGEQMAMPTGWRFGAFELYPAQRRLLRDGAPVEVEERALDLLVLLASHHDRDLERREVTTQLWGTRPVSDTTLRQVLHKARRAVDDDGEH